MADRPSHHADTNLRQVHEKTETSPGASIDARSFRAELDVAELGDRDEPGPAWSARAESLSRSRIAFKSRTLTYPARRVVIAVHLIDGEPLGFTGKVLSCEYCGGGLHHTVVELEYVPRDGKARDWLLARVTRRK